MVAAFFMISNLKTKKYQIQNCKLFLPFRINQFFASILDSLY